MTKLTPLKAIRKFCIECMGGSVYMPRNCSSANCPLYDFRQGHNPNRKGTGGSFKSTAQATMEAAEIN